VASKKYESKDSFDEVDDEKGILANILGDEVKNRFNRNGIPPHALSFKVDDVCIVLRAIPQLSLATNTRVQIVRLLRNGVRVKTLNEPTQRFVNLQRINFKFRLEYGESYQMTRIQLPLRLAYAMTYNKSQSQTLNKVLVDCTEEPFAHGHAYVSFSRVRNNDNISAYINE
jgi:ATP-dependent exoDNAse (exonuclease V) alpha subunit